MPMKAMTDEELKRLSDVVFEDARNDGLSLDAAYQATIRAVYNAGLEAAEDVTLEVRAIIVDTKGDTEESFWRLFGGIKAADRIGIRLGELTL